MPPASCPSVSSCPALSLHPSFTCSLFGPVSPLFLLLSSSFPCFFYFFLLIFSFVLLCRFSFFFLFSSFSHFSSFPLLFLFFFSFLFNSFSPPFYFPLFLLSIFSSFPLFLFSFSPLTFPLLSVFFPPGAGGWPQLQQERTVPAGPWQQPRSTRSTRSGGPWPHSPQLPAWGQHSSASFQGAEAMGWGCRRGRRIGGCVRGWGGWG